MLERILDVTLLIGRDVPRNLISMSILSTHGDLSADCGLSASKAAVMI